MKRWARSDVDYESMREAAIWQHATPPRYPDLIVQATSVEDVCAAITDPRTADRPVAVTGSGHNFAGTQLRDASLLVDVSALDTIEVDGDRAWVGPGVRNGDLCDALLQAERMFPTGHHADVGVGGYLLGGGMGWNGEFWGQYACFSVDAVDVVMSSGEVAKVDAQNHSDLFWAARGAGPFFPAVATGFHLRTVPAPAALLATRGEFSLADADRLATHLTRVGADGHHDLEIILLLHAAPAGVDATCVVLAIHHGSDATGESVLMEVTAGLPGGDELPVFPVTYPGLYSESLTGDARRCAVDSVWTNDPEAATHHLARAIAQAPSPWSVGIVNYRSSSTLPAGAACSVLGRAYVTWMAQWGERADDEANHAWVQGLCERLDAFTVGAYVNECDLVRRPARAELCFTSAARARLEKVRASYDPAGRFAGPQPDTRVAVPNGN